MEFKDLPDGWAKCTFEDLLDYIQPGKYIVESTEYSDSFRTPVLTPGKTFILGYTNESNGIFDQLPVIIFDDFTTASKYVNFPFKVKSSAMKILVPSSELVNLKFIDYCMQSIQIRSDTHKRYWISVYAKKPLHIPPLNEQRRIVAKIEELFSELDKGVESLKAAKLQLAIYQQSVLKAAFEGKLTESWRAEHAEDLESADELLARIKAEREARYEAQLAEWQASGGMIDGKKARKPKKPKELPPLTADELAALPELPVGWGWSRYGDLCSLVRNGVSAKPEGEAGVKIFRISAVRAMRFDMDDYRYIDNTSGEFDGYFLHRGDIVFSRYNGSRQYVGVSATYSSDEKRLFPDKLIQTRLDTALMDPLFVEKASNSGGSRAFIERRIRTTAGQSGIAGSDIKAMPIPICTSLEQRRIVQKVELRFSLVEKMEQTIEESLQKAEALRQSILKRAFEGKLVPQDPNDEPASELLARIQAEQKAMTPAKKKRKAA